MEELFCFPFLTWYLVPCQMSVSRTEAPKGFPGTLQEQCVPSLMQLLLYIFVIIFVLFCFIMGLRSPHTQQITAFPGLFIE